MGTRLARIGLALVALALLAPRLDAQGRPHTRAGFWFSAGLGIGSAGCDGCDGRESSLSGGLAIGGTLNPKVLLGAATTGWSKTEGGATLTIGTLVALVRFYPSETGGFHLQGGLGLGTVSADDPTFGNTSETGTGALVGLGYDFRVGANVSLVPYFNGFITNTESIDFNVWQIGLGVTLH